MQLSLRAIVVGAGLGLAFGVTNLYVGLKLGATFTLTLAVSALSFVLLRAITSIARGRSTSVIEATLAQTVAGAAMSMPSSGLVQAIPALLLVDRANGTNVLGDVGFFGLSIWVTAVSILGVIVAALLRSTHVNDATLPFPSATAAAEALQAMDRAAVKAVERVKALAVAAACAAIVRAIVTKLDVKGLFLPGKLGVRIAVPCKALGIGIDPSMAAAATGALLGPRIAASIVVGMLVSSVIAAPRLVDAGVVRFWSSVPDPKATPWSAFEQASKSEGWIAAKTIDAAGSAVAKWTTWPAATMIAVAALVAIAWRAPALFRATRALTRGSDRTTKRSNKPPALVLALIVAGIACVILARVLFGVGLGLASLAVALSIFLAAVAARVYGETDTVPSGPLGKVTQLLLVGAASGNMATNLVAANITAGSAAHAAELLGDLKTGALLGVSPRKQLVAQIIGVLVGGVGTVAVYRAFAAKGRLFTADFPATAARTWFATSELLLRGAAGLPIHAKAAIAGAALFGVATAVLERVLPPRRRAYVPSPVGVGLGFLLPAATSVTIFLGAIAGIIAIRSLGKSRESSVMVVAAGAMIGESIVDVVTTFMST